MSNDNLLKIEYNKLMQCALRELTKVNIVIDGVIGNQTLSCFKAFGDSIGYVFDKEPTALEGPLADTVYSLGKARYVVDSNYDAAAQALNVPTSYIRAVAEVETKYSAFFVDGRCAILFERHKFDFYLRDALTRPQVAEHVSKYLNISRSDVATIMRIMRDRYSDICSTAAGGYIGGIREYDRLDKARRFDQEVAFKSASWGRFQIMGFNHAAAGYDSAVSMALDFEKSEVNQFNGLVNFIKFNPTMHKALRNRDFKMFARHYNGPGYEKYSYDKNLDAAEKKWAKALAA